MKDRINGYCVPDAVTNYIDERNHSGWGSRGERVVEFAGIKEGDSVLDLCCGPGMVTKVIREAVGSNGRVVGIDTSEDFIKYAQTFCNENNVSFKTGNVEELGRLIKKQKFDVAILPASWLWIKNKEKLCTQVRKSLKPDGKFVLSLSGDNLDDEKTRKFYWKYRGNLKKAVLEVSPSTDLLYFNYLPVMNNNFVGGVIAQVANCGFGFLSQHEVQRDLTLEDKLFTYNNPARTEWVGDFISNVRLMIIKRALDKTASEVGNSCVIKRHTYYLVFGLSGKAK
jgi:ubiquinone/menaquinone biosynthesis C-methylase UbiE